MVYHTGRFSDYSRANKYRNMVECKELYVKINKDNCSAI